jgi:hypothetical protein
MNLRACVTELQVPCPDNCLGTSSVSRETSGVLVRWIILGHNIRWSILNLLRRPWSAATTSLPSCSQGSPAICGIRVRLGAAGRRNCTPKWDHQAADPGERAAMGGRQLNEQPTEHTSTCGPSQIGISGRTPRVHVKVLIDSPGSWQKAAARRRGVVFNSGEPFRCSRTHRRGRRTPVLCMDSIRSFKRALSPLPPTAFHPVLDALTTTHSPKPAGSIGGRADTCTARSPQGHRHGRLPAYSWN